MKAIGIALGLVVSQILSAQSEPTVKANALVSVVNFNNQPLSNAEVFFINTAVGKRFSGTSDESGHFSIGLGPGLYNIRLKYEGKTKDYTFIEIPRLKENEEYGKVEIVVQYDDASSFVLSKLHFQTNQSRINDAAFGELDDLASFMIDNQHLRIEVAGHTDNEGEGDANMLLSRQRAEVVKQYLESKGVSSERIIAKGYGESSPIAENSSEMGRSLNRRTEIHFLDEDGNRIR